MAPFRHPPQQSMPSPSDSERVRKWFARRDQFAPLGDRDLWPPPPTSPFSYEDVRAMAVSGDGKLAIVIVNRAAWSIDTQTLQVRPLHRVPSYTRAVILNDDGSRAVLVCESTIYVWDVASEGAEPEGMWTSGPLSHTEFLSMSRDGSTVAAADARRNAEIRIFDTVRKTLIYSFEADVDEGMCLHPDGKHIVCFGDDGYARIYGPAGLQQKLGRNSGGAISRDGAILLTNDLDSDHELCLYHLTVVGEELRVSSPRELPVGFRVERSCTKIRLSPSGRMAVVEGYDDQAYVVDLQGTERSSLAKTMGRSSAILADEARAFVGPGRHNPTHSCDVVTVAAIDEEPRILGTIAATDDSGSLRLVGTSLLGFFGALGEDTSPIGESRIKYYERPEMMPSILGGTSVAMSPDDEIRAQEVSERAAVWVPFLDHLTADIDHRDLMELNKGIVHLTRSIADRARDIDDDVVRFGARKLSWSALSAASAEIRATPILQQAQLFDEMLERLRRTESSDVVELSASIPAEVQALELRSQDALAQKRKVRWVVAGAVPTMAGIATLFYLLFA